MKVFKVLITVFASCFFLNTFSFACECDPPLNVEAEIERTQVVFIGTALSDIQIQNGDGQAILKVKRVFKGSPEKKVTVFTGGRGSCGVAFRKGTDYLIYASLQQQPQPRLWTTICYRTGEMAHMAGDVDTLERLLKQSLHKAAQPAAKPWKKSQ